MPTPWLKRIRTTGQLTVHNRAGAWAVAVDAAISKFNVLGFPVKLAAEKVETSANVVVKLSNGAETYTHYGDSATAQFDAAKLHGQTSTMADKKRNAIFFAVIFLPGKVPNVTAEQKEIITIHELIHACGLDGGRGDGTYDKQGQDHDSMGIMVANMKVDGKGLIEYMPDKNAKAMPPIRIGTQTICKLQRIWTATGCADD
ncbi:hypothetical protein [Luteolibacter sp. Populi]|uniref:hypothetical protein n=1 Tax=Luteolibacter sp. Populi TaxID=3230487 RepID=UPI00346698DB